MVSNWRSFVGSKGMPDAQVAYWESALRRMSASDEWKKELEANFWTNEFLDHVETRRLMDRDAVQLKAFLTELGLARQ